MFARFGTAAAVALAIVLAVTACGGGETAEPGTTTTAEQAPPAGTTSATTEGGTTTTETAPPSQTTTKAAPLPQRVIVVVENGLPADGIVRPKVRKGERVILVVSSDVADEVHVHGYDVSRPVAAGGTARLEFVASIPGRFEVELEERGVPIAELTVQ